MPVSAVDPLHPLAGIAAPGRHGAPGSAPLRIELPRREIVQIAVRRGHMAVTAAAMRTGFSLELPDPGRAATGPHATALWLQPSAWMVTAPWRAEGALASELQNVIGGYAAVVDQSHGRVTIAIEGTQARAVLAKGCRLDLHPRAFGPGRVAGTLIAQITCLIHQTDAAPRFELTMFSTLARPFFHWLSESAAEYGYDIA